MERTNDPYNPMTWTYCHECGEKDNFEKCGDYRTDTFRCKTCRYFWWHMDRFK